MVGVGLTQLVLGFQPFSLRLKFFPLFELEIEKKEKEQTNFV